MNRSEDEIKGLPGESFHRLFTGSPFYSYTVKLSSVGCVNILPDVKQGRSPHL